MSRPFYALFSQKQYRERSINSHAKEVPGNKRYIPACTVSEFLHVKILANKHCRGKSEILTAVSIFKASWNTFNFCYWTVIYMTRETLSNALGSGNSICYILHCFLKSSIAKDINKQPCERSKWVFTCKNACNKHCRENARCGRLFRDLEILISIFVPLLKRNLHDEAEPSATGWCGKTLSIFQ